MSVTYIMLRLVCEMPVQLSGADAGKAEIGFRLVNKDESVKEEVIIRELEVETT